MADSGKPQSKNMSPRKPTTPTSRKCSRCHETGHIASNKKCSMYIGTRNPPTPTKAVLPQRASPKSPPPKPKVDEILHCVRCHQDYPQSHVKRANLCMIPHAFEEFPSYTHFYGAGYSKDYHYDSMCCGPKKKVVEEGCGNDDYKMKGVGLCFRGRHTTDAGEVKYNKINVLRCKHNEAGDCVREWLEPDDDKPTFGVNIDNCDDDDDD